MDSSTSRGRSCASRVLHKAIILGLASGLPFAATQAAAPPPPTDVGISLLQFGGSVGQLMWTAVNLKTTADTGQALQDLAADIKYRLEQGRSVAGVATSTFNVAATGLTYMAAVDVEPTSKVVLGLASYGARKTGEFVADKVVNQIKADNRGILKRALKDSGMTVKDFEYLSKEELHKKFADLRIGGQKLSEVLSGDPQALQMVEGTLREAHDNATMYLIDKAKSTSKDVAAIKTRLTESTAKLTKYAEKLDSKLHAVSNTLEQVRSQTVEIGQKMEAVQSAVKGNTRAIQSLAEINYMGWSTEQKLQAVRGDLFPGLPDDAKKALIEQLQAEKRREDTVRIVGNVSSTFGELANAAGALGVEPKIVIGLQKAQIITNAIMAVVSGNPLAAISALGALGGLGKPDPTMAALAHIQEQLDQIYELQVRTLQAIEKLGEQMSRYHAEVMSKLDDIHSSVFVVGGMTQRLLKARWEACDALINDVPRGRLVLDSREQLLQLLDSPKAGERLQACYDRYVDEFDSVFLSGQWQAALWDDETFPTAAPNDLTGSQAREQTLQKARAAAYRAVRTFVLEAMGQKTEAYPYHLLRLSHPMSTEHAMEKLRSALNTAEFTGKYKNFTCNDRRLLPTGIWTLACQTRALADVPDAVRMSIVINDRKIGPQAPGLIASGVFIANLSSFLVDNNKVLPRPVVEKIRADYIDQAVKTAVTRGARNRLLQHLSSMADEMVVQEALMSGDYVAELVEQQLYDPSTHSLAVPAKTCDPSKGDLKNLAFCALANKNEVLARNVVLLAARHAIRDANGGGDSAAGMNYRQTDYHIGLKNLSTNDGCAGKDYANRIIQTLLPNWSIRYSVTEAMRDKYKDGKGKYQATNDPLRDCSVEKAEGAYVVVGDVRVPAPSASAIAEGTLFLSYDLRAAMARREYLNQSQADALIADSVRKVAKQRSPANPQRAEDDLARDVLGALAERYAQDVKAGTSVQ